MIKIKDSCMTVVLTVNRDGWNIINIVIEIQKIIFSLFYTEPRHGGTLSLLSRKHKDKSVLEEEIPGFRVHNSFISLIILITNVLILGQSLSLETTL